MTLHSWGQDPGVPTSADAAQMLRDIAPVTRRSRRLTRDTTLGRPLVAWGAGWLAGATLYQYVPGTAGLILGSLSCVAAAAGAWLIRPRDVRLPAERQFAVLWFVLLACSPLLVLVAAPANAKLTAVFLASLWAVGMVLYGIGTRDVPLAAVGSAIVVAAAAARLAVPGAALLTVGAGGGLAMAVLGCWRLRWRI